MATGNSSFLNLIRHPIKSRLFLLFRLPSAFFCGVRIRSINEINCVVSIPYKWFTKNPFRSTYFACLSMAAEMSTGALAMAHIYNSDEPISMLVVKVESEFFKKATDRTLFNCDEGHTFRKVIDQCIVSGEPGIVRAKSIGRNNRGEQVAEFYVTWSFKVRKKRQQI